MSHPCSTIIGSTDQFLEMIITKTMNLGLDISCWEIDHICYRCKSNEEYLNVTQSLLIYGELIVESMIGGRPISVILLNEPIIFHSFQIRCLEITCPKLGRSHHHGLEHVEVVIGSPTDSMFDSEQKLLEFQQKYPDIQFDLKAIHKHVNADICVDLGEASIKFHLRPLYEVATEEKRLGLVEQVPKDYFTIESNSWEVEGSS